MKNLVLITQVGMNLAITIVLSVVLGGLIDKWLNTRGVFSLIFLVLGIIAGFYNAYKLIMSLNKSEERKKVD